MNTNREEALFALALEKPAAQKLLGNGDEQVGWSLFGVGNTLLLEGRLAEGENFVRKAQVVFHNLYGSKHPDMALMLWLLGDILRDEGKLTEAESSLREALAMQKELLPKNHADTISVVVILAGVLEQQQGKLDEAVALYRQAADAGNGPAQAGLARLYAGGRGVPRIWPKRRSAIGRRWRNFVPKQTTGWPYQ